MEPPWRVCPHCTLSMSSRASSASGAARELLCSRCYKRESCVQCCGTRFCLRVRHGYPAHQGLCLVSSLAIQTRRCYCCMFGSEPSRYPHRFRKLFALIWALSWSCYFCLNGNHSPLGIAATWTAAVPILVFVLDVVIFLRICFQVLENCAKVGLNDRGA